MKSFFRWSGLLVGCALAGACGGGDDAPAGPPACVEGLKIDCGALLYSPPIYSTIYSGIIQTQCAIGSSCHSKDAAMGGLALANADDAYHTLLGEKGGKKYVVPNDPTCSPLMVRLESNDKDFVMPQGMQLTAEARCDFVQWIAQGAAQN
jgi:hypothetical protein